MDEMVDAETGEVIEHCAPFKIEMPEGATWTTAIVNQLQHHIQASKTIAEYDSWRLLNQDMLLRLKENKPQLFRLFEKN